MVGVPRDRRRPPSSGDAPNACDWARQPGYGCGCGRLPALIDHIVGLLDAIEDLFGYLTFRHDLRSRNYAATGHARCVALARTMCVVAAARPDTLGTITLPLFEAWMVAVYFHHGGEVAFTRLQQAFEYERRAIRQGFRA